MQPRARIKSSLGVCGSTSVAMLCNRNGLTDTRQALIMTSAASTETWASVTGGSLVFSTATNLQFDFALTPLSITLTLTNATGTAPAILYKINSNTKVSVASPVTLSIQPSDNIKVGITNSALACTGTMAISGAIGIPSIPYTCT